MGQSVSGSEIVSQAFRYMEMAPISSFDDDSEQAAAAAEQYPTALQICLEACDWAFASVLAQLPETTALGVSFVADEDLPFNFSPPGDLIRLHEVGWPDTLWRLDRDLLRADDPAPLRIRYTARITEEGRMPATFRDAVALRLACLLGPRYLVTQSKMQDLENRAQMTLKQAMRQDARNASQARYDDLDSAGDWVTEATR